MYVCVCHGVTDRAIARAAQEGASSLGELAQSLRVATCCGKCAELAQSLLKSDRRVNADTAILAPQELFGIISFHHGHLPALEIGQIRNIGGAVPH